MFVIEEYRRKLIGKMMVHKEKMDKLNDWTSKVLPAFTRSWLWDDTRMTSAPIDISKFEDCNAEGAILESLAKLYEGYKFNIVKEDPHIVRIKFCEKSAQCQEAVEVYNRKVVHQDKMTIDSVSNTVATWMNDPKSVRGVHPVPDACNVDVVLDALATLFPGVEFSWNDCKAVVFRIPVIAV